MILKAYRPAFVDESGEHGDFRSEWEPKLEIGFGLDSHCFVIDKRFGRYLVRECVVESYWFTGIWGYRLTNGWRFTADDYGKRIFGRNELQTAIEICEKKNRLRKVKVIRR